MQNRSCFHRVVTHAPLMVVLSCSTALPAGPLSTFCPQDTSAGSGNLDKPSGVAVAVHTHSDGSQSAYAVTLNPDLKQARAVDLTAGLMVPAPAVYFPMAVKLGSYSEDVAVSDDGNVAVALDAQDQTLRFFDLGDAKEGNAWKRHGDDVTHLDMRPSGLAVHGNQDALTVVVSHSGDPVGSLTVLLWSGGTVSNRRRINVGGIPTGLSLAVDGTVAVVSNARDALVYLVNLNVDPASITLPLPNCNTGTRPCALTVGGPSTAVVAGTVPGRPGDGAPRYPVALLMRGDKPAVDVVRLQFAADPSLGSAAWNQRMDSPLDHWEATVMLPRYPVAAALAPNPAPQCCQGLPFEVDPNALAGGGFAYAVVALVNGSVAYLDLNALDAAGNRMPRLIDKNSAQPGPLQDATCATVDYNTLVDNYRVPLQDVDGGPPADLSTRPIIEYAVGLDWTGSPPVVNQGLDDDYIWVFEGVLPGAQQRTLGASPAQLQAGLVEDIRPAVDLKAAGAQQGDVLEILPNATCPCPTTQADCAVVAALTVDAVAGATLRLADLSSVATCLNNGQTVSYNVRAAHQFTVTGGLSGKYLGRAAFLEWLDLPGIRVRMLPAGYVGGDPAQVTTRPGGQAGGPSTVVAANPPPRDAVVVVPMRSNFDGFILDIMDTDPTQGRYLPAGAVPTGIVTAVIPVKASSSTAAQLITKAVGVMTTSGGGLAFQFDLALHPSCPAPGAATCAAAVVCPSNVSRGNASAQFRFFE